MALPNFTSLREGDTRPDLNFISRKITFLVTHKAATTAWEETAHSTVVEAHAFLSWFVRHTWAATNLEACKDIATAVFKDKNKSMNNRDNQRAL